MIKKEQRIRLNRRDIMKKRGSYPNYKDKERLRQKQLRDAKETIMTKQERTKWKVLEKGSGNAEQPRS